MFFKKPILRYVTWNTERYLNMRNLIYTLTIPKAYV